MQHESAALKRRLTPSVPLTLNIENGDNTSFDVTLNLAFNMNVLAWVRERTKYNLLEDAFSWIDDPRNVIAVLWAASLPYQPEYNSDEGFETIGEYMTLENRVQIIEALLRAYTYFVRKDKREAFGKSAQQLIEILKTGKIPEGTENPPTESGMMNAASPSTSMTSQTSPDTTSESDPKNLEVLQPTA